jgi:hypothetical protein
MGSGCKIFLVPTVQLYRAEPYIVCSLYTIMRGYVLCNLDRAITVTLRTMDAR